MRPATLTIGLLFSLGTATAQDGGKPPAPPPAAEPTAAEQAFDAAVRGAEAVLRKSPAYTLKAESSWKQAADGKERSGTQTVALTALGSDKLRVEIGTPDRPARYVAAADGKALTRLYAAGKLYSVTDTARPRHDLQTDGLTVAGLRDSGVEFLFHPDLHGAVMAQAARVEDLGQAAGGGRELRAFRVALVSGRVVEVRFAIGAEPLPVSLRTSYTVATGETAGQTHTVETKLTWDLSVRPAADTFTVALPEGATRVPDLWDALVGRRADEVIGRPAGPAVFAGLDGKPVAVADLKGKVLVVYSWATWSAQGATDLPGLNRFVTEYAGRGVTFLAVNAGESAEAAGAFTKQAGFPGLVALDPRGEGLAALGLSVVPGVMVIGQDGTVRALLRGGRPHNRDEVRKALDALLASPPPKP